MALIWFFQTSDLSFWSKIAPHLVENLFDSFLFHITFASENSSTRIIKQNNSIYETIQIFIHFCDAYSSIRRNGTDHN